MRAQVLAVLVLIGGVAFSTQASAAVKVTITAHQPTKNGGLTIVIEDKNSLISATVTVTGVLATDTSAQKALKIHNAIVAKLLALGAPEKDTFVSGIAGSKVTVTKTGGGGMSVTIPTDTTGEPGETRGTYPSGGNGDHWFWILIRTHFGSTSVVPAGESCTVSLTSGESATVVGDGVKTASDLQGEITSQLEAQGMTFTIALDADLGTNVVESGLIPFGFTLPANGEGLDYSGECAEFIGGWGVALVELASPEEVPSLSHAGMLVLVSVMSVLGLVGLVTRRRCPS